MPSEFFGHKRQIELLEKSMQNGRLAHAYLFYGPDGIGKFTLAKLFAKALRCENGGHSLTAACDICVSCRQIETETHPHVTILGPEYPLDAEREKGKDISIADIRELKRIFSYAATGNAWRIAIINEADKISKDAANSFLKLLEEPGEKTLFVLIASSREALLQTIFSRTQAILFRPLAEKEMNKMLETSAADEILRKKILFLSDGRPGAAINLLKNPVLLEKEEKILKILGLILDRRNAPDVFFLSEKGARDEELRIKIMEDLIKLLREKMMRDPLSDDALSCVKKLKSIDRIGGLLDTTNLNTRLAMDMMFIKVRD